MLVTGSTGFIGMHVMRNLLSRNIQLIATSASEEKARTKDWYNRVTYIPFRLEEFDDNKDYYQFFGEPDAMIHLAWEGLPNYKDDFHEKVNLPRHYVFLTNLIRNGLKDLTVTGTCFEYGMQEGKLDEKMQVFPTNPYGRAKNELRLQLEEYKSRYSFSLKWVRLFYMYGEGQNPNSLLSQLERALERGEKTFDMSGGEQVRDYLPVEKVAENIVEIALQQETDGIINNCSGVPITVNELIENYLKKTNQSITLNRGVYPYPDYEPMRFWGDDGKLKKIIKNE